MKSAILVFLLTFMGSMLPSYSVQAMNMAQPVKLGTSDFSYNKGGGHFITGAEKIEATKYSFYNREQGYDKGYAVFDGGTLYNHFSSGKEPDLLFGSKDIKNAVKTITGVISKISTDSGITFYVIQGGYGGAYLDIIGRTSDGTYVKYADCFNLCELLIGNAAGDRYATIDSVKDDTIIISFMVGPKPIPKLKFQWNENAQWFDIERIE